MIVDEQTYIVDKWNLDINQPSPIEISGKSRVDLAHMFAELNFQTGAEIGTASGCYAYSLCSSNRKATLYCVDQWQVYPGYGDYTDQDQLNRIYQKAMRRLLPYDNVQFIRKHSMDALELFEDDSLDYVYIDANHEWPYITHDIFYWALKVRSGGIVSGHDYFYTERREGRCHVSSAVDGYTDAFDIHPWFLLHKEVHSDYERAMSWFWVKQ